MARIRAIRHGILPVSLKHRGLPNAARRAAAPPDFRLARITAAARIIARSVPGVGLGLPPSNDHVRVGHDAAIMKGIAAFVATV
ncbi:MAG: hypothetical protein ACK4TJ_04710 [Tabrizicola sp.]